VDYGCVDCQVTNNTIRNNGGYGVMIGDLYPEETHVTVVRNNIISGSPVAIYNPHGSQAIVEGNTTGEPGSAPAGVGAQPGAEVAGMPSASGTGEAGTEGGVGGASPSPPPPPRPTTALFAASAPS
jgi:Right handed beta helix region